MNLQLLKVKVTYRNKLIFQISFFKKIIIYYLLQTILYIKTILISLQYPAMQGLFDGKLLRASHFLCSWFKGCNQSMQSRDEVRTSLCSANWKLSADIITFILSTTLRLPSSSQEIALRVGNAQAVFSLLFSHQGDIAYSLFQLLTHSHVMIF